MKKFVLLFALILLSACEQYTDARSPCFGANGEPVAAVTLLPVQASDDCLFAPVGEDW